MSFRDWRIRRKVTAGYATILLALFGVAGYLVRGMLHLDVMRDQDSVRNQSLDEIRRIELEMMGLYAIWADATINHDLERARIMVERYERRFTLLLERTNALAETDDERQLAEAVRKSYSRYLETVRRGLTLMETSAQGEITGNLPAHTAHQRYDEEVDRVRDATLRAIGAFAEKHRVDAALGAAAFDRSIEGFINWAILLSLFGSILAIGVSLVAARSITEPIAGVVESLQRIASGDLSRNIKVERTDELGDILKASAEMQDALRRSIGEQNATMAALRESESKLRVIFETMSEGVALNEVVYDDAGEMVDYRVLEVNDAFHATADFGGRQVVGGLATELYGMSSELIRGFWREHRARTSVQHSQMVSPLSGHHYYVSTSPFLNHRFVTSFFDITSLKMAEAQTLAAKGKLEATLSAHPHLWFEVGGDGRIHDCHSSSDELRLNTREEMTGRTFEETLPAEAAATCMKSIREAAATGRSAGAEYTIPDPAGNRWFEVSVARIAMGGPGDETSRFILVARDVTARKEAELAVREMGERFRVVIDNALDAVITMDEAGLITVWNRQAEVIFGWTREEALGRFLQDLIVPHRYRVAHSSGLAEYLGGGLEALVGRRIEVTALRRTRLEFPVELAITSAPGGVRPQYTAFLRDITERKEAEGRLHLAASVFTHAREGITITDPQGTILDVNETFTTITGYRREDVLGRNPRLLKSGRQNASFYATLWDDLLAKGYWHGEVWNRRRNGEAYAELLTISAVRDAQGRTQAYVGLFSDITALKEQGQRLEYLAHYDPLTTLPNRGLLADRLRQGMAQAKRRGQLVAVAYLDLDGFKAVNDAHGHEVGDRLLIALAGRMKRSSREGDTLARIGGDEFVAIFLDLPDTQASVPLIARLLSAVDENLAVDDLVLRVSASLGVTFFPQVEDVDAEQLLRQADQAMYQAKLAGKGRYHVFDAQQDRSVRGHHEGLDRIRQALGQREFVLHYQPKVNMRTGQVMGAEALIRWQHPEKGLLAPAEFLPTIENHPLSIEMGEWVMDDVLTQMEVWRASGLHVPVSLNVGARQLQQPDFVDRLRGILAKHPGAPAGDLQIEVLETSALEDLVLVSEVIDTCRELGVSFALDDFGVGYSSLTYLKRLPVKMLKIDQSFVRGMLEDPEDLAILEGVVALAAAFGREVIAEGVETVEHGEMLLQLGCELAQGFGIARPMPPAEMKMWVTSWRPDVAWPGITAVNRRDLPVLFAGAELRAWIREVERYLDGERTVGPPLSHHRCRFGFWLDSLDAARRDQWPAIDVIEPAHERVHNLGKSLCDAAAVGGSDRPHAIHELYRARDEMLEHLKRLRREMRRGSHPTVPMPPRSTDEHLRRSVPQRFESVG